MPKKLTIIGALMVLVIGALGVFRSESASAFGTPVQTFVKTDINWDACFGGAAPAGGVLGCGAGSTDDGVSAPLAVNTTYTSWSIIKLNQGQRLTLPFTFTPNGPTGWQEDASLTTCGAL